MLTVNSLLNCWLLLFEVSGQIDWPRKSIRLIFFYHFLVGHFDHVGLARWTFWLCWVGSLDILTRFGFHVGHFDFVWSRICVTLARPPAPRDGKVARYEARFGLLLGRRGLLAAHRKNAPAVSQTDMAMNLDSAEEAPKIIVWWFWFFDLYLCYGFEEWYVCVVKTPPTICLRQCSLWVAMRKQWCWRQWNARHESQKVVWFLVVFPQDILSRFGYHVGHFV